MAGVISQTETAPDVLAEIRSGEGQSLSAVGRSFPAQRGGGTVNQSTVYRWITKGARSPDGRVVKLEACRVGGRWLTLRPAVSRFVAALSASTPSDPNPVPRSPAARSRAAAAASAELDALGIK